MERVLLTGREEWRMDKIRDERTDKVRRVRTPVRAEQACTILSALSWFGEKATSYLPVV